VITRDGFTADALATAFLCLSIEDMKAVIAKRPHSDDGDVSVIIVDAQGGIIRFSD